MAVAASAQAGIQQAFLVQNSGWMEPFYADPASQLKPLVNAVEQATTSADDTVSLLAFSQTAAGNVSPMLLGSYRGPTDLGPRLASLGVAHRGAALADTDFREAVVKTITGPFHSAPGIIWIFTNNRNSPGNDPETAARNLDFYRLIHLEPSISKTLVFPLRMPVKGRLYQAEGLMVYALAYGDEASRALDAILRAGRLSSVLTKPPARLKPLDADGLRIVPAAIENSADVHPSLAADQRTLILDVDAGRLTPEVVMRASLQNLFYPYVIRQANVVATLAAPGRETSVTVTPAVIANLQPGQTQSVVARFSLPVEKVPSAWSPAALAAMGKQVLVPMTVGMTLTDQQLALADDFRASLQAEFPGDPISDIFAAPPGVTASRVQIPVVLRIQYPLLPVIVVVGLVLALLAALASLALLSGKTRRFPIVIDGISRHIVMKPFSRLELRNHDGVPAGTVRRGLGKPSIVSQADGHTLKL
ncbi:hypothetical protein [Burkholderia sp. 22PA0106]|uniref:hypothetical protein n=1 Tax=Burkholderia sp. 22PA0106 TaxID=3237371 RepID=UPI0039C0DB3E